MALDILIKNNYYITENNYNDNFHIAIYYLCDNKCKIIIRRHEHDKWGQDLKIILCSIDNNGEERISLGSCNQNIKIMEIYTNIKLYKTTYQTQIIPKTIIQISNESNNKNIYNYNSIMSFVELNPDYEHIIFNDKECREFIINNSDKFNIIDLYDNLYNSYIKDNLFKLFYLYIKGGCYFHYNMILKTPLSKIIDSKDNLILCKDNDEFYNELLCCEKNNVLIHDFLEKIVDKEVLIKNTIKDIFKIDNNANTKLIKNGNNICDINNNFILEYNESDNVNSSCEYFFKSVLIIKNYKFYFFPSEYNDTFDIIELKNNIFLIKRTDATHGWGQHIRLKVIDNDTNDIFNIYIGDSDENERPFIVE
jgi:hypothetical protein